MRFSYNMFVHFDFIELLSFFFIFANVLTFFLYAIDKLKAKKGTRRISEKVLIFFTIAFGGVGALLGMCLLRHKTRKGKFKSAVAIGLLIALVSVAYFVHSLIPGSSLRNEYTSYASEQVIEPECTAVIDFALQVPTERIYGAWSQWFGFIDVDRYDNEMFIPFESGVGEIYFLNDGTGHHIAPLYGTATYFTWEISDYVIILSDSTNNWSGKLHVDIYERWEIVIFWGGAAPDWGHVNSIWGLQPIRR